MLRIVAGERVARGDPLRGAGIQNPLDRYVEAGGTFIDTSNNYAFWQTGSRGGESEALLGRWLKDREHHD